MAGQQVNATTDATSKSNPTNQGMAKRADQKAANSPNKILETTKKSIYPLTSAGTVVPSPEEPLTTTADFYRYGKYEPGYTKKNELSVESPIMVIPPRDFTPLDFKDKPSSIRIWGKLKAPNVGAGKDKTSGTMGDLIPTYTKFILESVQESRVERSQIVETFGDFYVFMFGERPPVFNFSGTLINSMYTNWVNDFDYMYDTFLRGTKCVESNATTIITYGGRQVEGLILNMGTQTNAAVEGGVPVNFSVVVFNRRSFNFSEDMGYSTSDNLSLAVDEEFKKVLAQIAGPEGKGMSRPEASLANKMVSGAFSKGEPCDGVFTKSNEASA